MTAKEIGSEFWTEKNNGEGVGPLLAQIGQSVITICGRTALELIAEDILRSSSKAEHSVYMPSYCCHTMIEPFLKHGIPIRFYDVYPSEEGIKCKFEDNECGIVFLIDYFGFIDPETKAFAEKERGRGKTIICDRSHSLLCTSDFGYADYTLGSFRKWFGVNAGFAAKAAEWNINPQMRNNDAYCDLRNRAFDLKARYISGTEEVDKSLFLSMFGEAEEMLEKDYSHYVPDSRSLKTLETADTGGIRNRRRRNAAFLMDALRDTEGLLLPYRTLGTDECPLFVPVCTPKRDGLRRGLIAEWIYCPAHWPVSEVHALNEETRVIYDTEMSVVCDQRYDPDDMKRIADSIRRVLKNI